VCSQYDLSSVNSIFTGAAPLGAETAEELQKVYPDWKIKQGYGKPLTTHPKLILIFLQDSQKPVP
jgi:acyl-coenzyme A synthetase/AMP-(fatty) acid ligase